MLVDTNTFVDLLRNFQPAKSAFQKLLFGQSASVTTKFELIVGSTDKSDLLKLLSRLKTLEITFLPITPEVCNKAEDILTKYHLQKGILAEDAFIAATALVYNEELVTRNKKHFDFIPDLKIIVPY